MDDLCPRCLTPNDEGPHRPSCRTKTCPDCHAHRDFPHDPYGACVERARSRYEGEMK